MTFNEKKMDLEIVHSDSMGVLNLLQDESINLIYIDPPFNTGNIQKRGPLGYDDSFGDYQSFITPFLLESRRVLHDEGSIFVHLDKNEVHYVKVWMDKIFGRDNFRNEIIWAYDYGGRGKKSWPAKHDNILWYSKTGTYTFNYDDIDRIPYMAPGLVTATAGGDAEGKVLRGKVPTDVWWNTIVPTNGREKTGYPTQKPVAILRRIVKVHSRPGDQCLDYFAGSGSFGQACLELGRSVMLVDNNSQAIDVIKRRLIKETNDDARAQVRNR